MSSWTIAEIKKIIEDDSYTEEMLSAWEQDHRSGVKKLMNTYYKRQKKQQEQKELYQSMMQYEIAYYKQGKNYIAGIDEAGRGPLAGPVVAASVILDKDSYLPGLNDSKQLSEAARDALYEQITLQAVAYGVGIVDSEVIDDINIYQATMLAMKKSVDNLSQYPDQVLVDAVPLKNLQCPAEAIIKGDQKSVSIAAASIIAKVTRDRLMKELHQTFPMYGFEKNMGYGTKNHLEALQQYGVTIHHRRTFAPVKAVISE